MSDPVAGKAAPPPEASPAPDATPPPDSASDPDTNIIDTKLLANELVKNLDAPATENQITPAADPGPEVKFKLVYNKTNYEIVMGENRSIRELKDHIETLTKLPRAMQKLMFKGLVKDDTKTLKELKVVKNSKMMLVGTTMSDLVAVTTKPTTAEIAAHTSSVSTKKESLSKQKIHQKVLDKGKPEDAMPGIVGVKQPLPSHPLNGMVNKTGGKVRLTFKLEEDSLWIGTKARTEKITMSNIRNVVSEKIESNPEYAIMGIQLGPTELSIYWIYWVPAQYVDAVKDTILGKWQTFF